MYVLLPCYSLEDFSLYRKSSEVDEIFSAWTALFHPALVAHFGEAPRWEPAGSPSSGKPRRLVVIPACADAQVPKSWIKSAQEEGAIVIQKAADRDEILKIAFEKLGIDAPVADDAAESFASVGLCCLLEELLTRKLRYMSNLDQISFNSRIVEAARANASGNAEERENCLQKAFDLLAQAKEYFFPVATKFLELTWLEEEDFADNFPRALRRQRERDEKSNLLLPVSQLKICRERYPETFALLKEEIAAKRVVLIGGDEWEGPLYLQSPLEIIKTLIAGRNEYLNSFGVAPQIFARREAGYAQILPQLLKLSGYRAAFARTGDGWTLLEKPSDRSQFRWQGRDGSTIAAFCKKPLDASDSEEILQLPDRIGNSYYADDSASIVFERRPNKESRWLFDLFRMNRYSPVLGKFYDFNEYFRLTEGSGDKEKFVKDNFKTNFLTRSAKKERVDLVSIWPRRQRLGRLAATLAGLETSIRLTTLKVKRTRDAALETLFSDYLERSNALSRRIDAALDALDARFLAAQSDVDLEKVKQKNIIADNIENEIKPSSQNELDAVTKSETHEEPKKKTSKEVLKNTIVPVQTTPTKTISSDKNPNEDCIFENLEQEKNEMVDAAARFVASALKSLNSEGSSGFLFVNPNSNPQEIYWETRRAVENETVGADSSLLSGSSLGSRQNNEVVVHSKSQQNATSASGVKIRTFPGNAGFRRHCATLPPISSFWIPEINGVEYHFLNRSLFETGTIKEPSSTTEATIKNVRDVSSTKQEETKRSSFFQKISSKLRSSVAVSKRFDLSEAPTKRGDSKGSFALVEYVEEQFSAKESEHYYLLKNEYFEIKIDPVSGAVRRLTTFNIDVPVVSNGLLRQPSRGNRFAWDFALKLPERLRNEDFRSKDDSCFGYSTSAADKITILTAGPGFGKLRIDGRTVAPNGETAAKITQILTIRRESRIIEVEVEITPQIQVSGAPWDSYFACRFAWKDSLADLLGGVGASLIWTGRDYLQAPECVDIRSEDNIGITVLSAGLPYFKRIDDTRLDAILIPSGETKTHFRFGIGVDLENPHSAALAFAELPLFVLPNVPRPKRATVPFFSSSKKNVCILEFRPILSDPRDANSATRLNGMFVGVRLVLLETQSSATSTTIQSFLPLDRIESVDFTGATLDDEIKLPNATSFELEFKPRQIRVLNLYFSRSSLN